MKQEEVAHARVRALTQVLLDKEKGVEAFEEYMRAAFPWVITANKKDKRAQIDKLMDEVKRGPMAVKPLWQGKIGSRLKEKQDKAMSQDQHKTVDALLKRMGKVVPR